MHSETDDGFDDAAEVAMQSSTMSACSVRSAWQRFQIFVGELIRTWRARGRRRAECAALAGLDAATLRDLGIEFSEIGSIAAEQSGHSASTRRRIVHIDDEVAATSRLRVTYLDCTPTASSVRSATVRGGRAESQMSSVARNITCGRTTARRA